MTTEVIIKACCGDDTEVLVSVIDNVTNPTEEVILQNGESTEKYVYDNREIRVIERKKQ